MSDKEVRIRITGDASDLLKKLEAIKDSFDDLGGNKSSNKAINNLIDDLKRVEDRTEDVGDKMEDMLNVRARNNRLNDIADSLEKIDDKADDTAESLEKIDKHTKDVDTKQYDALEKQMKNLYDSGDKANEMFSNMGEQISKLEAVDIDFSSAKKDISKLVNSGDDLGSDLASGLTSGFVAGNMMSKALGDITSSIDELTSSLKDMENLSMKDKVKAFDDFAKTIEDQEKKVENLKGSMNEASEYIGEYEANMLDSANALRAHDKAVDEAEKNYADYKKQVSELNNEIDKLINSQFEYYDELSKFQREQSAHEKDLAKYRQEYDSLNKAIEDNKKAMADNRSAYDNTAQAADNYTNRIEENITNIEKLKQQMDKINKDLKEIADTMEGGGLNTEEINEYVQAAKVLEQASNSAVKAIRDLGQENQDLMDTLQKMPQELRELNKEYEELENKADAFEQQKKGLEAYGEELDKTTKHIDELGKALDNKDAKLDNWGKSIQDREKELSDLGKQLEETNKKLNEDGDKKQKKYDEAVQAYKEQQKAVSDYGKEIEKAENKLEKLLDKEDKYIQTLGEKESAYNKLVKKTSDFLDENMYDTNIFALEELVNAIEGARKSLDRMTFDGRGSDDTKEEIEELLKKLDGNHIKTITEGAAETLKDLDLMDFDNLIDEFESLGEAIDDKVDKTKKLRDMNQDFDDATSKTAYGLRLQAEELKAWADTAGYATKIIDAYNDESGEQMLTGKVVGNKKALEESLNPKKLREYNKAFSDYISLIKETGGQIDARYLNDKGAFDVHKFIADIERFGQPVKQLTARLNSLKQQTLEHLKITEQDRAEMAQAARERLKNADAIKKEAEVLKKKSAVAIKEQQDHQDSIKNIKQGVDAKLEEVKAYIESAKAKAKEGDATDESNKKLEDAIKLQKELSDVSKKLGEDIAKSDKEIAQSKEKLNKAIEDIAKAEKESAKATQALHKASQEAAIESAKAKLEEAKQSEKAAKAKMDEAKAEAELAKKSKTLTLDAINTKKEELLLANKAAKLIHEQAQEQSRLESSAELDDIMRQAREEIIRARAEWNQLNQEVKELSKYQDKATYSKAISQAGLASYDYKQAVEAVAEAEKELARAQESSLDSKAKAIRYANEYAETLRKLGIEIEGIERSDIEAFDKSLASQLDNKFKDLFDSDIPETFKEMVEDIKAALAEFNNLEFGKGFDLLKDAGKGLAKGVFAAIPKQAKIATAAIAALTLGLTKLYQAGKQDFLTGFSNIGNKLQPIINMVQNLGQEMVAAFEEITDTDVDLSSLMALGPNFEYQMTKVGAIAGSNDRQLKELTKTAEHLGGVTQYTASDVGEAFQYMAMAGYDTEEMLSSINGVLSLSIASGSDLAETTDIVTECNWSLTQKCVA